MAVKKPPRDFLKQSEALQKLQALPWHVLFDRITDNVMHAREGELGMNIFKTCKPINLQETMNFLGKHFFECGRSISEHL